MNIAEIEKVVRSFQGAVFKRANSTSAGMLKSKIKGTGLQFRDHQIYAHGDDVRFIDWKVSARNSNIHLKTFEEDRNTEINVILDISPTMFYGSSGITKLQVCFELAALLYLLSKQNNDQVKLYIIMNNKVTVLPPQKGKLGVIVFIKQLEMLGLYGGDGKINLSQLNRIKVNDEQLIKTELNKLIYKRKEIIFLGDMDFGNQLKELLVRSKNCHPVKIISPIDIAPLTYSINSGRFKGTGLGYINKHTINIPTLSTSEKYLELFMRRLQ